MPKIGPLPQQVSTLWKYAFIGGVASLPLTTLSYWETGSAVSLVAVLFGGTLAGYLHKRGGNASGGIGVRVGLVGGLPVLWILADVFSATSSLAGPTWYVTSASLLAIGFTFVVAVLGFGIAALIGEIGTRIGSRLVGN